MAASNSGCELQLARIADVKLGLQVFFLRRTLRHFDQAGGDVDADRDETAPRQLQAVTTGPQPTSRMRAPSAIATAR
jgi:hypothetical protein